MGSLKVAVFFVYLYAGMWAISNINLMVCRVYINAMGCCEFSVFCRYFSFTAKDTSPFLSG